MFRDSASQVAPKLPFDERRNRMPAYLLTREKRFQLFGDDAVQNGFFRLAWNIFERSRRPRSRERQEFSQLQSSSDQ